MMEEDVLTDEEDPRSFAPISCFAHHPPLLPFNAVVIYICIVCFTNIYYDSPYFCHNNDHLPKHQFE